MKSRQQRGTVVAWSWAGLTTRVHAARLVWRDRRIRSLGLQLVISSYLAMGLVVGIFVAALDHHGIERNPAHGHITLTGSPASEHDHSFQLAHSHRATSGHNHPAQTQVTIAVDDATLTVQPDVPTITIVSSLVSFLLTLTLGPLGLPSAWALLFGLLALGTLRSPTPTLAHQYALAPAVRPPTLHSR